MSLNQEKFKQDFKAVDKVLSESELFKKAEKSLTDLMPSTSFTKAEKANAYASFLAQSYIGALQTAIQTALNLDSNYNQAQQAKEKGKIEIEIFKVQMEKSEQEKIALQSQILENKVKAFSIAKSANDNALINKANLYTSWVNIVSNAVHTTTTKEYVRNVTRHIESIGKDNSFKFLAELNNLTEKTTELIHIWTDDDILKVNQFTKLHITSSHDIVDIKWEVENELISTLKEPIISFSTGGLKLITFKCTIKKFKSNTVEKTTAYKPRDDDTDIQFKDYGEEGTFETKEIVKEINILVLD